MLYVVATPIGNLDDMAPRGLELLRQVAIIAAEDTRRTGQLLKAFDVATPVLAYHAHNEAEVTERLLARLRQGEDVALVSDAGTPLLSDPGFPLVAACHAEGIPVAPVPGPSSLTAALSVSGLPVSSFAFEGFLPAKRTARQALLKSLAPEQRTLVFFEAPHRVRDTLEDISAIFGADRGLAVCRELTKQFEQVVQGEAAQVCQMMPAALPARGEFVLVVAGNPAPPQSLDGTLLLQELLKALPPSKAAAITARVTGADRAALYQQALAAGKPGPKDEA